MGLHVSPNRKLITLLRFVKKTGHFYQFDRTTDQSVVRVHLSFEKGWSTRFGSFTGEFDRPGSINIAW